MKKIEILKNKRIIDDVFKNGKKKLLSNFVIYEYDYELDRPLFVVAAGKSLGNAVNRNKAKRIIRSIVDDNKKFFKYNKIYIIIGKRTLLNNKYVDLKNEIHQYLINSEEK